MSICKTAANAEWQESGGVLEIPDEWNVCGANFDTVEPYVKISNSTSTEEKKLPVPKSLAYYLSMHHCGSAYMHEIIDSNARQQLRDEIKQVLGI